MLNRGYKPKTVQSAISEIVKKKAENVIAMQRKNRHKQGSTCHAASFRTPMEYHMK